MCVFPPVYPISRTRNIFRTHLRDQVSPDDEIGGGSGLNCGFWKSGADKRRSNVSVIWGRRKFMNPSMWKADFDHRKAFGTVLKKICLIATHTSMKSSKVRSTRKPSQSSYNRVAVSKNSLCQIRQN